MDALSNFSTRAVAQSRPADTRQTQNAAGGYTFEVSNVERLRRFLTLGVDSGTYYVGADTLTAENAGVVLKMAHEDHRTLVNTIVDVSLRGAAPKQNPTLFALAIASSYGDAAERSYALSQLHRVARTGTHLFLFAGYVENFRGWGRGLRKAVGEWYTDKPADRLAYQAVKYRQRNGWSHRDLLRLAHPKTDDAALRSLFGWITSGSTDEHTPRTVEGFLKAQEPGADVARLVRDYRLSWEMLPTEALNSPRVWEALLDTGIPVGALIRQLPRLTRMRLLPAMGGRTEEVAQRISDPETLRMSRIHPINLLVAQRTYSGGYSARGESAWKPVRKITDALDAAFYAAFDVVEPAGKRTLNALDVSGSMGIRINNLPLTAREASAALAMVNLATEPDASVVGFTSPHGLSSLHDSALQPLGISPRQRLDDVVREVSGLPFGGTDCSLPMVYALKEGLEVDTFIVYTDSETWAGRNHPHLALREYREKTGINAKMIVVGMTATSASIADPTDPGMLDIAGFDTAVPNLITEFSRGV